MDAPRRFATTTALVVLIGFGHAVATWPPDAVVALFGGGAVLAFALEAVGIVAGLFRHEMRPQVLGVPLVVVGAWPATVYLAYRVALLGLSPGVPAAAGAAAIATAIDLPLEVRAVEAGVWSYPEHPLSAVRIRGVPLWNAVGWLVIVFVTAMLPTLLG